MIVKGTRGGGYILRFLFWLRLAQSTRVSLVRLVCRVVLRYYSTHYGLEIPWDVRIGDGLYLGHAFNITINSKVVIGANCNIHKGVTIGQENRGQRKGCPVIGSCVWIGVGAVVVGRITVGDDVLIAPNSYVNRDIPSHSIVVGNPCVIHPRENATEGYINDKVEA